MSPIDASDRRDRLIGVRGDPDTLQHITRIAARHGDPGTVWARDRLLDALEAETGYRDTTRRRVPRRPNQQPRHDKQRDPAGLWIRVSATENQLITRLAEDKGSTITDWAWGVLEQAMRKEGKQR